jgi:uncharacterized repeat protein (TIGR01451 family)
VMSNSGNAPAQVSFSDPLPAHTTYITAHVFPATHSPPVYVAPTLTWNDAIAPDEVVTLAINVLVDPGTVTGTTISNVAWFQELSLPGPVLNAGVTNTVRSPVYSAVKRSTPVTDVHPGEVISYDIVLANQDLGIARVVLTDTIPDHTAYVTTSAQASSGPPPTYDPNYDRLTWQGDVAAYSAVTLTFAVTVELDTGDGEAISNVAWLRESSQPGVVTISATNTVVRPLLDALKLVEPAGTVYSGDVLTYTIVMTNSGGSPAQISFSDAVPSYTTYIAGSAHISPATHHAPVYHPVISTLTWEDNIAPHSAAILTFQAQVDPGTPAGVLIPNVAWLQELSEPGSPFSVTVTNSVLATAFSAVKRSVPVGDVRPGEIISYHIVLGNATAGTARVVVTDTIPTHTTYISGSADAGAGGSSPSYDPIHNRLTWQGDILSYRAVTLTFGVTVSMDVEAGTIITNVAWIDELSDPAGAASYSVVNTVAGQEIYLPIVLRNH